MRILILFLLLWNHAWAYPRKALDMTDYEYRRYVRPQLRSIIQDTHTLLFLLNPEFKSIKEAFTNARELLKSQLELKDNCLQTQIAPCMESIKELKSILNNMSKNTINAPNLSKKEYLTLDEKLAANQEFSAFKNQLLKAQNAVDDIILKEVVSAPKSLYLRMVKHEVNDTVNTFYSYVTKASDNRFTEQFNNYWTTFVVPVYKHILVEDKSSYFLDNISELNLRWNNLNVRLTKRNKDVSKQILTLLQIMHNRWNNILKVSLNPQKF